MMKLLYSFENYGYFIYLIYTWFWDTMSNSQAKKPKSTKHLGIKEQWIKKLRKEEKQENKMFKRFLKFMITLILTGPITYSDLNVIHEYLYKSFYSQIYVSFRSFISN